MLVDYMQIRDLSIHGFRSVSGVLKSVFLQILKSDYTIIYNNY